MISGIHPLHILRAGLVVAWLIVCAPFAIAVLPFSACRRVRLLLWPIVRRGKLLRTDDSSSREETFGILKVAVPQSFFSHFYYLGLTWNSSLVVLSIGIAQNCSDMAMKEVAGEFLKELGSQAACLGDTWRQVFLLLLFEVHLARRLFECLFVSSFLSSARMGLLTYFFGLGYYVAVPLTLFLQSFRGDRCIRAFEHVLIQRRISADFQPNFSQGLSHLGKLGWMFYLGAAVSVYGMIHQHSCHKILASLRSGNRQKQGQGSLKYGIPRGDWFEVSSSAHYLAEIVIYVGLVIASSGVNLAMWFMLMAVAANLYLLAVPTHEWYLSKFENYPTSRRPLFPWIGN